MKQLADIVKNYQAINNCQRFAETVKQAYLSATDYHEYSWFYVAVTTMQPLQIWQELLL